MEIERYRSRSKYYVKESKFLIFSFFLYFFKYMLASLVHGRLYADGGGNVYVSNERVF